MRVKRVNKFRRSRLKRNRNVVFFAFILPFALVFLGYLISSFLFLPVMSTR
ncbi:hypothetical protein [Anaerobacterium chartisolvens]|uniref:hypothetical protein n=1 Tax=Anaerobacterium chartisolvens TaxID=1297424 RepID=UPI001475314B|nr:hypothetical protein [Anaerobacterium chartisolvens]